MRGLQWLSFWAVWVTASLVIADTKPADTAPLAPGYGELGYQLPESGSYQLPSLGKAADGTVLDEQGKTHQLHDLMQDGKYTLLSFVYSNCKDVNGCPLAGYVFYKIKALMQENSELSENLRLLSLSFDPERDTPEIMRLYATNYRYAGKAGEWKFLTTSSEEALRPLLSAYKQDIQREVTVNGDQTTDYSHLLRVFLIDPSLKIRNIYSVGFLHPDILITDLETLLLEDKNGKNTVIAKVDNVDPSLSRPGDAKDGYVGNSYQTDSQSLDSREQLGKETDLYKLAKNPPLGLPSQSFEVIKSLSPEKIKLGRKLFFDRRLSLNDTFSCAMCHIPEQGFTSNEMKTAVGFEGRSVRRNTPSLYNTAYLERLFHDGREFGLEEQIWAPLLASNEMANPSIGYVLDKIRRIPDYEGRFEQVYQDSVSMELLGDALAAYQRTLLSANSPFDRWYYGKQADAMNEDAIKGFQLFKGKAACMTCHTVTEKHALFTDQKLHNTGLGFQASMGKAPEKQRVILAPGVSIDVDTSLIDTVAEPPPKDLGLYEMTQNPADRWKYKTPSLRNVTLTAPYMHNGELSTLEDVVRFYNQGGVPNENLSPLMRPLGLDDAEVGYLVAFLKSLTGSNVDELVADAFAAPVGDLKANDPNWANDSTKP